MLTWIIIGLIAWVPLLIYGIERRGFVVLLGWLFIAPIGANLLEYRGRNVFSSQEIRQEVSNNASTILADERDWRHLFVPNRLLFAGFAMVFALEAVVKKKRLGPFDKAEKRMGVFSVVLIGSLLLYSQAIGYNFRVLADAFIVPFFAYFVARRLTTSEWRLRILIQVLGYVGAYLLLMAIIQGAVTDIRRVSGPFEHRDSLYIVIIVVFFAVLSSHLGWKVLNEKHFVAHWLRWSVITATPIVVLLTWTRGNWIGFGVGLWVFVAFSFRLMNLRRGLATLGLVVLLIPVILAVSQEFSTSGYMAERISNERTIHARLAAWQAILSAGLDNPILGVGLGNTRTLLSSTVEKFEESKNLSSTHNSFLALFGELGLVGLLAYLAVILALIQMGLSLYKKGMYYPVRWQGISIISIVTAHLVPAFFSNILFTPVVSHTYVFVILGAIAGACKSQFQRSPSSMSETTKLLKIT